MSSRGGRKLDDTEHVAEFLFALRALELSGGHYVQSDGEPISLSA